MEKKLVPSYVIGIQGRKQKEHSVPSYDDCSQGCTTKNERGKRGKRAWLSHPRPRQKKSKTGESVPSYGHRIQGYTIKDQGGVRYKSRGQILVLGVEIGT